MVMVALVAWNFPARPERSQPQGLLLLGATLVMGKWVILQYKIEYDYYLLASQLVRQISINTSIEFGDFRI